MTNASHQKTPKRDFAGKECDAGLAEETVRALIGSWYVLMGQLQAVERHFNLSDRGFWRSFFAMAVGLPIFLLAIRLGIPALETADQRAMANAVMFRQIMLIAAGWVGWLFLAALITKGLGYAAHFGRYVILYNWSTPLVALLQVVPMALYAFGLIREEAAGFLALFLVGIVLYLRWQNARLGLLAPVFPALIFPAAELLFSLALSRLFA